LPPVEYPKNPKIGPPYYGAIHLLLKFHFLEEFFDFCVSA
jgi:hypothetical protein